MMPQDGTHAVGSGWDAPSGHIRLEVVGSAAWLLLDRPDRGNSWLQQMWGEAIEALELAAARDEVRVVLLAAAGGSVFSGGADLDELAALAAGADAAARAQGLLDDVERFLSAIEQSPQLVVAVVDGAAFGAGLEIAAACDLRLASDRARFGVPAARHGIVIARPDVARLARLVGWALASELLLTARTLDAEEAHRRGLVSSVTPSAELREAAEDLVARVSTLSARSLAAMKRHLHAVWPAVGMDEQGFADSRAALISDELRTALLTRHGASSARPPTQADPNPQRQ